MVSWRDESSPSQSVASGHHLASPLTVTWVMMAMRMATTTTTMINHHHHFPDLTAFPRF
jgi:lactam utilization protein B